MEVTHCVFPVGRKATRRDLEAHGMPLCLFWDTRAPSYSILPVSGMDLTLYLQCKSRLDSSLFPENYDCLQSFRPASSSFDSLDGSPRIILSGSIMVLRTVQKKSSG